jgi:hypothetical protein
MATVHYVLAMWNVIDYPIGLRFGVNGVPANLNADQIGPRTFEGYVPNVVVTSTVGVHLTLSGPIGAEWSLTVEIMQGDKVVGSAIPKPIVQHLPKYGISDYLRLHPVAWS